LLGVVSVTDRPPQRLIPIVVLVTPETHAALNDYVTVTHSYIVNDAPDVEQALRKVSEANGWAPSMLIGGQLLAEALLGGPA
jgi:hypothetical protein